jgi:hypothetical protein
LSACYVLQNAKEFTQGKGAGRMGNYLKIPCEILTAPKYKYVSHAAKIVYILLFQTENLKDSDKGQLELMDGYSVASLANITPPTFRICLAELQKAGLIESYGELIEIKEPLK